MGVFPYYRSRTCRSTLLFKESTIKPGDSPRAVLKIKSLSWGRDGADVKDLKIARSSNRGLGYLCSLLAMTFLNIIRWWWWWYHSLTAHQCEWVLSKFNGTSTPKGSYRAKKGDNDCNVNSSYYSLSTALCESIRYQAKSEQNVR